MESTGLLGCSEKSDREREWKREMVDIQACWTACGFFLQGSLTHITHFTHMGCCHLNAPLSSAQVFKGCGTYCCDPSLCIWPQGGGEKPHIQECQAEFLEGCVWSSLTEASHYKAEGFLNYFRREFNQLQFFFTITRTNFLILRSLFQNSSHCEHSISLCGLNWIIYHQF